MINKEIEEGKVCVILLWLTGLIGLIWYLADENMKRNSFAKYHLKQWLIFVIFSVVWYFVYAIVYFILSLVTMGLFAFIGWIGFFVPFVWMVQGLVYGIQGEQKPIFLIGQYAEKWFKF